MNDVFVVGVAGIFAIVWVQLIRFSEAVLAKFIIGSIKTTELSSGQMIRFEYSIFKGVQDILLDDPLPEKKAMSVPSDKSPLPAAYNKNPLFDAKRNAFLIISLSRREANYDKLATKILGVSKIDGMGHEVWKKAIQYMVDYHGIIKGQPGKSGKCGTDGLAPATLDTLQHAIRVHQIPPAPAE